MLGYPRFLNNRSSACICAPRVFATAKLRGSSRSQYLQSSSRWAAPSRNWPRSPMDTESRVHSSVDNKKSNQNPHLSDEQLLITVEGESSAHEAAEVKVHLE